jgi:hypothetical protein
MIRILLLWLAVCCAVPRAGAAWPDERAAGAFIWHADHSLKAHAALLAELPQLQRDVCTALALPPPREPIHVFVFANKETYQAYLAQHFPKAPARRAVFLKGRGPGMVFAYASDELATDLRHECTHALLHAALPDLPLWLDEGLAEYFETPRSGPRQKSAHLTVVQTQAQVGLPPRLEALEAISEFERFGRNEYRDAWAWTHFLLEGMREGPTLVRGYLQELREQRDPGPLSQRVRQALPEAEQRLVQHFLTLERRSATAAVK